MLNAARGYAFIHVFAICFTACPKRSNELLKVNRHFVRVFLIFNPLLIS